MTDKLILILLAAALGSCASRNTTGAAMTDQLPTHEAAASQRPGVSSAPNGIAVADTGFFDSQGHRGARGLAPENTWPAMKVALDLGVRTLEMDVVISRDRKVVLSHDAYLNPDITTGPDGQGIAKTPHMSLFQMDYAEISRYDVGLKPYARFPRQQRVAVTKPLLSDLLDQVAAYMQTSRRPLPFFNIETKLSPAGDQTSNPPPAEFVELLMQVIREKGVEDRVIIQSFDFRTLTYLHQAYPKIRTAMLLEATDKRTLEEQLQAAGFQPNIYSPEHSMVTEQLIRACHERHMQIIPWTVNDAARIRELRSMGVDGVISDYPDLFKK